MDPRTGGNPLGSYDAATGGGELSETFQVFTLDLAFLHGPLRFDDRLDFDDARLDAGIDEGEDDLEDGLPFLRLRSLS